MLNSVIDIGTIERVNSLPFLTATPSLKEMSVMAETSISHPRVKKQSNRMDLIGQRYGRLAVTEELREHRQSDGKPIRRFGCLCDCGNYVEVPMGRLRNGETKSCGCYKIECLKDRMTTHGLCDHKLYTVWDNMKRRCLDSNNPGYSDYGERGIKICDEWKGFEAFFKWAVKAGWSPGLYIDRRIVNDGYNPTNCRFVDSNLNGQNTRLLKASNTSGYAGVSRCKSQKNPWHARIRCNNKRYDLGYYKTPEEAAHIRDKKAKELNAGHPLNFN